MSLSFSDNPTRNCLALACIIVAAIVIDQFLISTRFRADGPVLELSAPQTLTVRAATDTIDIALRRGDSVRILGLERLSRSQRYLVETAGGERGWMDASQLPVRQILNSGAMEDDTVTITGASRSRLNGAVQAYYYNTPEGRDSIKAADMVPVLADWEDLCIDGGAKPAVYTTARLTDMTGRSLADVEKLAGPAYELAHIPGGGFAAVFGSKAVDTRTGKQYTPTVTFGPDSLAASVGFTYYRDRSDWLIGLLPGAGFIIDMPLTRLLTRGSIYETDGDSHGMAWYTKVWYFILALLYLLLELIWFVGPACLPMLIAGWLIGVPRVFGFLKDGQLKILIAVLGIAGCYWWTVALLGWGMFWIFAAIPIAATVYAYRLSIEILDGSAVRCPKCGAIDSYSYTETTPGGSAQTKGKITIPGDVISTRFWEKQTTTTREKMIGGRLRPEVSTETEEYAEDTRRVFDYEVTYRVDYHIAHHVCSCCGHDKPTRRSTKTEIGRRYIGQRMVTETRPLHPDER